MRLENTKNKVIFFFDFHIAKTIYRIAQKRRKDSDSNCFWLCIFFAYYRDWRTITDIAESTTFDIISLVKNELISDEKFHLPSKRALLKANIKVAVIDATECSIQRPKKNSENSTPAKRDGTP